MESRSLPVVPRSCSLDAAGLEAQAARYRSAGDGALVVAREPRRFEVVLGPDTDSAEVEELVAVERDCCPFFEIGWEAGGAATQLRRRSPGGRAGARRDRVRAGTRVRFSLSQGLRTRADP